MSENTQQLAEQIAKLLHKNEREVDDSAFLRLSLEKINQRLDKIESQIDQNQPKAFTARFSKNHPSLEKYDVAEAVSAEGETEKICTFEPHEKPCDYCSMCSSRGF